MLINETDFFVFKIEIILLMIGHEFQSNNRSY